ncbi:hypothetical protein WCP94_002486 [Bilophila wadsworthia]
MRIKLFSERSSFDAFLWALWGSLSYFKFNGNPWEGARGFDKRSRLWKREMRPSQAGSGKGNFPEEKVPLPRNTFCSS